MKHEHKNVIYEEGLHYSLQIPLRIYHMSTENPKNPRGLSGVTYAASEF
jgi:hypothetical protein